VEAEEAVFPLFFLLFSLAQINPPVNALLKSDILFFFGLRGL